MGEKWMIWTIYEAVTRTAARSFLNIVGRVSSSLAEVALATTIIGFVQVTIGFIKARSLSKNLLTKKKEIVGACAFGVLAAIVTILGFRVYMLGGDLGVDTFITTLSIIPGLFLDWWIFKHPPEKRHWPALILALTAAYFILGRPSLGDVLLLPTWIGLSFISMFLIAGNQGISQAIKDIDPFVKNFWGGLTQVVTMLIFLPFVYNSESIGKNFLKIMLVAVCVGVINVCMWYFNQKSYNEGAYIALKKLVLNGTFLSLAVITGVLFFGNTLTLDKVLGILLFFVSFSIWDEKSWNFIKSRVLHTKKKVTVEN